MGKRAEVEVYDKYYELFRLQPTKSMGIRNSRVSNNKFSKSFKVIRDKYTNSTHICATCGFPVNKHKLEVHKRFHIYYRTRFDMYEPFKDLIQSQYIKELAIDLLRNEWYKNSLSDRMLVSVVESLMLAEYMDYITLNIKYAADYQYDCKYMITLDNMDILRYKAYGYSWLSVNLRALNIGRVNVLRELIKRYKIRVDDYDNWYYDLVGDIEDGD